MESDVVFVESHRVQLDRLRLAAGLFSLLGLVWVGWAYFNLYRAGGPLLIMIGLASIAGAFYAFIGLGKAPCPECGYLHSGLGLKNNASLKCRGCDGYFHTRDGEAFVTESDAIEDYPAFSTPCPQNIVWPPGCCVCGQAVTRTAPVRLEMEEDAPLATSMLTRAATLGTFKLVSTRTFEVQVPVCDEHTSECARLEYRYDEEQLHISFRSRAYARAFDETNGPVFWGS